MSITKRRELASNIQAYQKIYKGEKKLRPPPKECAYEGWISNWDGRDCRTFSRMALIVLRGVIPPSWFSIW